MAKTIIYTIAETAVIMQKLSNEGIDDVPISILSIKPTDNDMREVTVKYNDPQDLFLLGLITAMEWAKQIKIDTGDREFFNRKNQF